MAVLEVLKGKTPGLIIEVQSDRTVFGRHPHCQVVLENAAVSRYHAQILETHGGVFIEDLRSRNGTYVNESLVEGRRELKDKDLIRVCDFAFRFLKIAPSDSKLLKPGEIADYDGVKVGPKSMLDDDEDTHQSINPLASDDFIASLASSDLHLRGWSVCAALEREILDSASILSRKLRELYRHIVVFDFKNGVAVDGEFDKERFLLHLWERLAKCSGIPFVASQFHPELIAQIVQDLKNCLYCFLHVEHMKNDTYHHLRGIGFSRHDNRIIYSGNSNLLDEKTTESVRNTPPINSQYGDEFGFQIEEEEDEGDRSSIISTLDAGSSSDNRLGVKPETKLKAILEISKSLSRAASLEQVLDKTLDGLFRIFAQADEGFIMLRDQEKNKLVVKAIKTSRKAEGDDQVHVSMTIVRKALDTSEGILSANALGDSRFKASESLSSLRIRSMICAPMLSKDLGPLGVIQITTNDVGAQLRHEDLDLLISVAMQVGLAVENAYLYHQTLLQRDLERDLEFATQVQLGFLPNSRPKLPGYAFSDYYEPAQRVGGDYFDYIPLPDGRLAVALAEVAGKGVPAALLMARLYSSVRYHLLSHADLNSVMAGLNAEISVSGLGHRFITCVLLVIDPATHQLTVVNAGHLPPLRRNTAGCVEAIGATESGLPLGILPNQTFQQTVYDLAPGETWLVFTDGVTEAIRMPQEIYGNKRLMKFLETGPAKIDELIKAVVDDVDAYVEGQAQSDDICMVGFQRLET